MFGLFKKKEKKKEKPALTDLENQPLAVGDLVESLRYDMGTCRILEDEKGLVYESINSGTQKSWVYMIDAATERQKVRKINQDQ